MTDIAKAVGFATHCLKWTDPREVQTMQGTLVCDRDSDLQFNPESVTDLERVLQEFLGKRYFIQINRGTSSLFHWCVMVGLQDVSARGVNFDKAQAEGEDLRDAIFDACVAASRLK